MHKKYRETFDGVHASGRLRMEVMNITQQERTGNKRRIPRAALIAAALAVTLAGTAVAAEGFGWITLEPVENFLNTGEPGYHLKADIELLPLDSLPQEIRRRGTPQGKRWESDAYCFTSWSEAEEFLGMELADNPRLEQMRHLAVSSSRSDRSSVSSHCLLEVSYLELNSMPGLIAVRASYTENGYLFSVSASMYTEAYEIDSLQDPNILGYYWQPEEDSEWEEYTTPNGLKVTILTDRQEKWGTNYTYFQANFVIDGVLFHIFTCADDAPHDHPQDPETAMALLKEVLDAYQ